MQGDTRLVRDLIGGLATYPHSRSGNSSFVIGSNLPSFNALRHENLIDTIPTHPAREKNVPRQRIVPESLFERQRRETPDAPAQVRFVGVGRIIVLVPRHKERTFRRQSAMFSMGGKRVRTILHDVRIVEESGTGPVLRCG